MSQLIPLVSIILPYYNRKDKIKHTLDSFSYFYKNYKNLEIIIVDDYSTEEHKLNQLIKNYSLNIKLIDLGSNNEKKKYTVNPCYPYNVGVRNSCGNIIVLSSPETFHTTDIFKITNNFEKLNDESYLLLSTFCSTDELLTDTIFNNNFQLSEEIKTKFITDLGKDGRPSFNNIYGSWYLHSEYKKSDLNFYSCITRNTYYKLCGFDERYRNGTGYDDNEFVDRLKTIIISNNFHYYDNAYAIHINHEIVHNLPPTTNKSIYDKKESYLSNNKWGKFKEKIKRIGFFCSFGIGGADKVTELLSNYFHINNDFEFLFFYNNYCFPNPNKRNYIDCRYMNYNSYKMIYIDRTENLLNYDLELLIVHRGGDEHWLLPNFADIKFNFKIVEINFHGDTKTKCDYRIVPSIEIFNKVSKSFDITKLFLIGNPISLKINDSDLKMDLNIQNKFIYGRISRNDIGIYTDINLQAYKKIENDDTVFLYINPVDQAKIDAKNLQIKNIIFLNGAINPYEISKIYNTFDVLCHSNRLGETFGNTIPEAINHNKIAISHNGSIKYPQSHKIFFKDTDLFIDIYHRRTNIKLIDEYAILMNRCKNDQKYYQMCLVILKKNVAMYDIEIIGKQYIDLFTDIIK